MGRTRILTAVVLVLVLAVGAAPCPAATKAAEEPGGAVGRAGRNTTLDLGGDVKMTFVAIPAGSFQMGSPSSEPGHARYEEPTHTVSFARPFLMGTTEVTQAQWQAVMGSNPSKFTGPGRPVEQVSWDDAKEFCSRLSSKVGQTVRLPTEAEWEYAARAGSVEPRYGDLDAIAWYSGNSGAQTHDVGGKAANAWGLFDMLGNVWEWCEDAWRFSYTGEPTDRPPALGGGNRVLRGGSWRNDALGCRAARRYSGHPSHGASYNGFRVVLSPSRGE